MAYFITKYLTLKDVVACMGVCCEWRACFAPCLWSEISPEEEIALAPHTSQPSQPLCPRPPRHCYSFCIRRLAMRRPPTQNRQIDKAHAPTERFNTSSPSTHNCLFIWSIMHRPARRVESLSHYATTLRELNMRNCTLFTGVMALNCLEACTGLVKFVVREIAADELVKRAGVDEDTNKRWLCCGQLRHLEARFSGMVSVRIPGDGADKAAHDRFQRALRQHMFVFERLAELTVLEELWVELPGRADEWRAELEEVGIRRRRSRGELMFNLMTGLECLQGLKRLRTLGVRGLRQKVTVQDAIWMRGNWPSLKKIEGMLVPCRDRHRVLVKIATGK
ncbi:hypothetical protein BG003_006218 [Podila horticola]|nr:hypothetical protein BG003_006218 [Podila horticola]